MSSRYWTLDSSTKKPRFSSFYFVMTLRILFHREASNGSPATSLREPRRRSPILPPRYRNSTFSSDSLIKIVNALFRRTNRNELQPSPPSRFLSYFLLGEQLYIYPAYQLTKEHDFLKGRWERWKWPSTIPTTVARSAESLRNKNARAVV